MLSKRQNGQQYIREKAVEQSIKGKPYQWYEVQYSPLLTIVTIFAGVVSSLCAYVEALL